MIAISVFIFGITGQYYIRILKIDKDIQKGLFSESRKIIVEPFKTIFAMMLFFFIFNLWDINIFD